MSARWMCLAAIVLGLTGCQYSKVASNVPSETQTVAKTVDVPTVKHPSRIYQLDELQVRTVKIKGKPFRLWMMDTDGKRQEGMMFLQDQDVASDQGMLFNLEKDIDPTGGYGFWMKNCSVALDIIYLDSKGKVLNIGKGEPHNETPVSAAGKYRYVVELRQGTSEKIGLKAGDSIPVGG